MRVLHRSTHAPVVFLDGLCHFAPKTIKTKNKTLDCQRRRDARQLSFIYIILFSSFCRLVSNFWLSMPTEESPQIHKYEESMRDRINRHEIVGPTLAPHEMPSIEIRLVIINNKHERNNIYLWFHSHGRRPFAMLPTRNCRHRLHRSWVVLVHRCRTISMHQFDVRRLMKLSFCTRRCFGTLETRQFKVFSVGSTFSQRS